MDADEYVRNLESVFWIYFGYFLIIFLFIIHRRYHVFYFISPWFKYYVIYIANCLYFFITFITNITIIVYSVIN